MKLWHHSYTHDNGLLHQCHPLATKSCIFSSLIIQKYEMEITESLMLFCHESLLEIPFYLTKKIFLSLKSLLDEISHM